MAPGPTDLSRIDVDVQSPFDHCFSYRSAVIRLGAGVSRALRTHAFSSWKRFARVIEVGLGTSNANLSNARSEIFHSGGARIRESADAASKKLGGLIQSSRFMIRCPLFVLSRSLTIQEEHRLNWRLTKLVG